MQHILYECGICDCFHPWNWNGDCRDNENSYGSPEDYAERFSLDELTIEVRSMDERVDADCA